MATLSNVYHIDKGDIKKWQDKAMSAASNAFAELAEKAKDEADMLLRQIEELETLAKKVLKLFKSLPLNDIRIDNTKK